MKVICLSMYTDFSGHVDSVIDGEIYHGSVKEKAKAQQQYDAAKKLGQSAGQIKRRSVLSFTISLNVCVVFEPHYSYFYTETYTHLSIIH